VVVLRTLVVEVVDEADGVGELEQAASSTAPAPSAITITSGRTGRQGDTAGAYASSGLT
jgi:hypothetical protein